jgi:phthalate 4,5-cis-dihydrodiol dehydrogenase
LSARASLRFGIVGLGRAAAATVPAIVRNSNTQVVAAADTNADVLESFTRRYSARGYANIEALCEDRAVDAVYVATPTHLHTQHVLAAVAAGKHVICEKPLAITLEDAGQMIAAVDDRGVQFIVGQSQSYEPPIRAIRQLVRSGDLGRLGMINGWYYNDWLYRPRLPAELDTRMGGGVVFRQGAHHFDIARLIAGGVVRALRASTRVWDPARPTEGSYSALLDFEGGATANLVYSGYDHFFSTELTGGQTEGGGRVDPAHQPYAAARRALAAADDVTLKRQVGSVGLGRDRAPEYPAYFGLLVVSCEHGDIRQTPEGLMVYGDDERWPIPLEPGVSGRDLMIGELYDAVVNGKAPLHSGRWARATLEVSLAVLESARTRREVLLSQQVATGD